MKTLALITAMILSCSIVLGQNENRDIRGQLDSMRQAVLAPKLKLYDQRVENLVTLISETTDKNCIKQYARQIVQITETMQDNIGELYDCSSSLTRGGVYVGMGMGMGPWFYPGWGGYMNAYPYAYDYYGYNCLPPIYYEVGKVKKYANSIRLFSGHKNVNSKLGSLHQEMELLKKIEGNPKETQGISMQ